MNLEKLREIRTKRGVTQSTIGRALGYESSSGYCSLETGVHEIKVSQIPTIIKILDMNDSEAVEVFCKD